MAIGINLKLAFGFLMFFFSFLVVRHAFGISILSILNQNNHTESGGEKKTQTWTILEHKMHLISFQIILALANGMERTNQAHKMLSYSWNTPRQWLSPSTNRKYLLFHHTMEFKVQHIYYLNIFASYFLLPPPPLRLYVSPSLFRFFTFHSILSFSSSAKERARSLSTFVFSLCFIRFCYLHALMLVPLRFLARSFGFHLISCHNISIQFDDLSSLILWHSNLCVSRFSSTSIRKIIIKLHSNRSELNNR